jgi:indolepyruvate ferredoxin oxidoreductase
MAGIGCHGMALSVPNRRTQTISHMGAEGVTWIGQAPFTSEQHVFQNLGDGTYTHSGLLAIRAAAASGVNITYKILYNDAVAMTGGQPAEGGLTVSQIAHQVAAEGAKRLVIVSDDPEKYPSNYFPSGATVHHRRELDAVQKELREVKGLTVLIYDQTCAAEKRRRRKRGLYPDPAKRVFINERVCEGCGDCSVVSNCVSVQPLETEFGRKRRIDQSNCNKDFSCIEGFCPSFVTVHGGKLRKADRTAADPSALFADLPTPSTPALDGAYNILVTGIGGTGVITIGALLGMAAHVEGLACSTLDFTGLSQKNGAVMSHVRIAPEADDLATVRIAPGGANLILGCDIVVATSIPALSRAERGVTRAIVNADLLPTASFVINPDIDFEAGTMRDSLNGAVSASDLDILDATGLATALMGDSIATNAFMLGFAFQRGAIPLSLEAIMKAIELNGAAIDMNRLAFSWGRLAAHDLQRVVTAARFKNSGAAPVKRTLDESIAFRAKFLTEYQNEAYSKRYLAEVERVRAAEAKGSPGSHDLTDAFAKGLFKLMAYKDEYEVARLYSDGEFAKVLKEQFDGDPGVKVSLAPPLLASRDKGTGHLRKREFGSWIFRAFDILTRFKFLRGTALDPFGYTAERRMERALPGEYSAMISRHLDRAKPQDWPRLVLLAKSAELVRGYGHIKEANVAKYRAECARLEGAIGQPVAQAAE